jgi:hypothetical protein
MDVGNSHGWTEKFMKAIFNTTYEVDMESSLGVMEDPTKGIGKTVSKME